MIICRGRQVEEGDKWTAWMSDFDKLYQEAYAKFSEPYDIDEDGDISERENEERPNMTIRDIVR